jgi:ATP-dependent DNA helicase PIF1
MPFILRRRQFPVRPTFGMTINKAQGQTLKMVGIFLPKPVFTHG